MSEKLFLDTNVVLDLLGEREPFYVAAAQIATLADKGKVVLSVSALTYATVYYLLCKFENKEDVKAKIVKFRVLAETSDLSDKIIALGLSSKFKDFEDALQYHCALEAECDILISRNGKDFIGSEIPVMSPDEYLSKLNVG